MMISACLLVPSFFTVRTPIHCSALTVASSRVTGKVKVSLKRQVCFIRKKDRVRLPSSLTAFTCAT